MVEATEVGLTDQEKAKLLAERNEAQARAQAGPSSGSSSGSSAGTLSASQSGADSSSLSLPVPEALKPEELSGLVASVANPMLKRWQVEQLDQEELARVGIMCAPALNRYVPWLFLNHKELVLAGMCVAGIAGVRIAAAVERRRAREEAAKRAPSAPPKKEETRAAA